MAKPAIDLRSMTSKEKIELIDDLWVSLDSQLPLSSEQETELNRRLDRLDVEGPIGVSWESVRAEMTPKP